MRDDRPVPESTPNEAPQTAELARQLGVGPGHLQRFVDHHPDPRTEHVLEMAGAGEEHAPQVAAWLRDHEPRSARLYGRARGGGAR